MIMKKICMALLLAVMATTIKAQVTANVRVGGGVGTISHWEIYHNSTGVVSLALQANIPFTEGSSYTFSPSLFFIATPTKDYYSSSCGFLAPLQVGKKISINR